ncbi:MAG: hypothetical protein MJA27_17815 [Pseudanabaenales cyanobacterium]|nr:hypothetical protein [Pseudanabaenales cyanobacterium]
MKTFQELQIGDYFRIEDIYAESVYRKASDSQCSLNAGLQPIRPETRVIPLSAREIAEHFAKKQEFLNSLKR